MWRKLGRIALISLWFLVLTFPLMIIQVNTATEVVTLKWNRLLVVFVSSFFLSWVWLSALERKNKGTRSSGMLQEKLHDLTTRWQLLMKNFRLRRMLIIVLAGLMVLLPVLTSFYQVRIFTSAMVFIILGLGMNIILGLGGMLNFGYAALFAIGAYSYALITQHWGLNFWVAFPISAILTMIAGAIITLPVIRLRGDYLAIVTLAFGEVIRTVLENWGEVTNGPRGISNIVGPGFFGMDFSIQQKSIYIFYITLAVLGITIWTIRRLTHSRLGRSWEAIREDTLASQTMGIHLSWSKLVIFIIGAFWAGVAGVLFAVNTGFISPRSFTVTQSILILCIVVLGGIGSIPGVILGGAILILLPEYLRFLTDYRLLVFGALLITMMVFRPQGIIPQKRKMYTFHEVNSK